MKMDVRTLSDLELEAVCGGVVEGGCIVPTKPGLPTMTSSDWVFVDQFASRLPSWVRPA